MFEITTALVVASLLCLAIDSTRKYAVLTVALLSLLYPLLSLVLLLAGGAVFAYVRFHLRRSKS